MSNVVICNRKCVFQDPSLAWACLLVSHRSSGFSLRGSPRYLSLCLWRKIHLIHFLFLLSQHPVYFLHACFSCTQHFWIVLFTCRVSRRSLPRPHNHPSALSLTTHLHLFLRIITPHRLLSGLQLLGGLRESPSGTKGQDLCLHCTCSEIRGMTYPFPWEVMRGHWQEVGGGTPPGNWEMLWPLGEVYELRQDGGHISKETS